MIEIPVKNFAKNADRLSRSGKISWIHKRINVNWEKDKSSRPRTKLCDQHRFLKNIGSAKAWLKAADSTLIQLKKFIIEVEKIAMGKTSKDRSRKQAAQEVEKLFLEILKMAKSQDTRKDVFVSNHATFSLFRKEEDEAAYQRDADKIELEIEPNLVIKINLLGSSFLTKPLKTLGGDFDLDPGIDQNTRLSDLNRGRGVNLGSIRIAKNDADLLGDVNLSRAITVGDVIQAINSYEIARIPRLLGLENGLSADINSSHKGLKLTSMGSNQANFGEGFTVSEVDRTTARDLGILNNSTGSCGLFGKSASPVRSLEGEDLNPILTKKTPVSLLKSGHGLTLGAIKIALGDSIRNVDLSSASTVGEIIDAINNSMPGVMASINNNSQKGICVESTVAGKSLVVSDGDGTKSVHGLGISGSPDTLGALLFLMEGLNNDDSEAISKSLEILSLSLDEISNLRVEAEAKLRILENVEARMMRFQSDTIRVLSEIRGTDWFNTTTNLTNQKTLYQSVLQREGAMIQPTLLDFIR
jgi:flagellin-like hook-associated protein FlgL